MSDAEKAVHLHREHYLAVAGDAPVEPEEEHQWAVEGTRDLAQMSREDVARAVERNRDREGVD